MSTLRVDNLNARTGTSITIPSGTTLFAPGHVLQVVQGYLLTSFQSTSSTYVDIGLSVTFNPKSSTSVLMHFVSTTGRSGCLAGGRIVDGSGNIVAPYPTSLFQSGYYAAHWNINNYNNGDGNIQDTTAFHMIETSAVGTTSSITRKIQGRTEGNGQAFSINRPTGASTSVPYPSCISTLITVEIGQ